MREIWACSFEIAYLKQPMRIPVTRKVQALEAGHPTREVGKGVKPKDGQLDKMRECVFEQAGNERGAVGRTRCAEGKGFESRSRKA